MNTKAINVLLVEDSREDVDLIREALMESALQINFFVLDNGEDAINFLQNKKNFRQAKRPDLIILDLNLPRRSGHEVLSVIKEHKRLKTIPVVILTTSQASSEMIQNYKSYGNCYICKPLEFEKYSDVVREIEQFWSNAKRTLVNRISSITNGDRDG